MDGSRRARAVGQPLDLTDASLDHAAEVTPVDEALAQSVWRHHAPPKLASLLDVAPKPADGRL